MTRIIGSLVRLGQPNNRNNHLVHSCTSIKNEGIEDVFYVAGILGHCGYGWTQSLGKSIQNKNHVEIFSMII